MQQYISEDDFSRACDIPELNALNDKQRVFVWEWAHNGCDTRKSAAAAGLHEKSCYALLKRDDVVAAIKALTDRMLHSSTIPAIAALLEILNDTTHKDRAKVAFGILNRTGFPEVHEHRVKVEKVPNELEMIEAATRLAEKMGVDPKTLLGANTRVPVIELKALPVPADPEPYAGAPDGSDL